MEKFNDMNQLECDPFLPCADILLGDQLIHKEEEDNGGITDIINLHAAGKSYNIYIYLVTEKEYGWLRDLGSRASSSVKYSHDP